MRDDRGECRADNEQHWPADAPGGIKTGKLDEQIDSVDGAVRNVGQHGQDKETQQEIDCEPLTRHRPCKNEMREHDGEESAVVDQPARFPVSERVGRVRAKSREKISHRDSAPRMLNAASTPPTMM